MSAWESGRRRTGKRNRAGLCQLYRGRPEVLSGVDGLATGATSQEISGPHLRDAARAVYNGFWT
ncbi:hypothetical protein ACFUJR_17265 [Streptomyces sp. NPDC057271]|uniref:hypothetical protein n=1 Tax=unclassified Streptomyces TaxID=2593676 RepID=UPI0036316BDC